MIFDLSGSGTTDPGAKLHSLSFFLIHNIYGAVGNLNYSVTGGSQWSYSFEYHGSYDNRGELIIDVDSITENKRLRAGKKSIGVM